MKHFHPLLAALPLLAGFSLGLPAAFAQGVPSGGSSPMGDMQSPKLQPKFPAPQPAPDAIPGASSQPLQTSQSMSQPQSGDPTQQLFDAINKNDYNSAQDAISRGADLNAQNTLGETPIDLSVALNRNSITFMLLAARNDSGDGPGAAPAGAAPVMSAAIHPGKAHATAQSPAQPARLVEKPAPEANPGTPNTSAGFLGFNH